MKSVALFLVTILGTLCAYASPIAPVEPPVVFAISDAFEKDYEKLGETYPVGLLAACNCEMEEAFSKWVTMLHEVETFADKSGVDLKGVKLWMHVFFGADGSIDHIAYHLRPSSRVVELDEMTKLLTGFASQYSFPMVSETPFQHYSVGAFPVFGDVDASKE